MHRTPTPRVRADTAGILNRPRFTPAEIERIEAHERAVGIEHVRLVDRAAQIQHALHARGYGVRVWSEPGVRDGETIWHATASVWHTTCAGCSQQPKLIEHTTALSRVRALEALAGELGVVV